MWKMSDYQHLPTQDEVSAYDPRWVRDMQLAQQLWSFQHNDSPVLAHAEKMRQQKLHQALHGGEKRD